MQCEYTECGCATLLVLSLTLAANLEFLKSGIFVEILPASDGLENDVDHLGGVLAQDVNRNRDRATSLRIGHENIDENIIKGVLVLIVILVVGFVRTNNMDDIFERHV